MPSAPIQRRVAPAIHGAHPGGAPHPDLPVGCEQHEGADLAPPAAIERILGDHDPHLSPVPDTGPCGRQEIRIGHGLAFGCIGTPASLMGERDDRGCPPGQQAGSATGGAGPAPVPPRPGLHARVSWRVAPLNDSACGPCPASQSVCLSIHGLAGRFRRVQPCEAELRGHHLLDDGAEIGHIRVDLFIHLQHQNAGEQRGGEVQDRTGQGDAGDILHFGSYDQLRQVLIGRIDRVALQQEPLCGRLQGRAGVIPRRIIG